MGVAWGGGGGIFKLRFDWYIRMKKSIGNFKGKNFYFFPTGGGGFPYNGLYGEVLSDRGTFFKLQVYKI